MKTKPTLVDCTNDIENYLTRAERYGRGDDLDQWVFKNDRHILGTLDLLTYADLFQSMESIVRLQLRSPYKNLAFHWDGAFLTVFSLTPDLLVRGMKRFAQPLR